VQPDQYQIINGFIPLDYLVRHAGQGTPDVFGGHHSFYGHNKNLLLLAGKRLQVCLFFSVPLPASPG
jgi:hypothetical protein